MVATLPIANPAWRTQNIGYLLLTANGWCIRDKLRTLHLAGYGAITDTQLTLFHHIDLEGTKLTEIAERAGSTKQSMIELVDKAEAMAFVERSPDPADGRARIVRFTPDGRRVLERLQQAIAAAEHQVAEVVGSAFLIDLKRALGAYVGIAGSPDDTNVARLFSLASRHFARDALHLVHERGHREVTEVLLALFRNLDLDGMRLTDVAKRARMTKQSMRELVDRAEALGLAERLPHPSDKRAKSILFTPAGLAMLEEMRRGVMEAEINLVRRVGEPFLILMKERLTAYNASASLTV